MHDLFVVTAPGLEALALREVQALGLPARAAAGGVELQGTVREVMLLNLWLRTATRVLVRLGAVKATAFPELVRKASQLPWAAFVRPGARVEVRATCRKSRLYHSGGVAERLLLALQSQVKGAAEGEGQLLVARFDRDVCTVSVDSSGELLHMRGWRGPQAKAPLRETLAAALLLAAGYDGSEPLCDPLCGSGTIAIEGASIALQRAPGLGRRFAFEQWPGFSHGEYQRVREQARALGQPARFAIEASDQDAGAVAATKENAAKAGVEVRVVQRRLAELPPDQGGGLVACNPPYGVRVVAGNVWRELGEALRRRPRWRVAAVIADDRAAADARLGFRAVVRTENGGLRVALSATSAQQSDALPGALRGQSPRTSGAAQRRSAKK
jgi:putative N6-adenine-specific DNA methylase